MDADIEAAFLKLPAHLLRYSIAFGHEIECGSIPHLHFEPGQKHTPIMAFDGIDIVVEYECESLLSRPSPPA